MLEKLAGKNIVVYDCEIQNEIDGKNVTWATYDKMGLAVAALYDYVDGDYKVYLEKDVDDLFSRLLEADLVVGFNIKGFDNKLIDALKNSALDLTDSVLEDYLKSWDIYEHSLKAHGYIGGVRPKGLRLDDHLKGIFGEAFAKTMDGAQAPIEWQRGNEAKVITYCLADVRREKMLFEHILIHGWVYTETHGKRYVNTQGVRNLLDIKDPLTGIQNAVMESFYK